MSPRTGLLLPAATGFLVVAGLLVNRGEGWRVAEVSGAGSAQVNGRAVALTQAALARALAEGGTIELPAGASLVLEAPRRLAIELGSGSTAHLGPPPARWLGRIARARLSTGALRVTTGAGFRGSRLTVGTAEVAVEIGGTTLAVIRDPKGTCVCVMEGAVRMGAPRAGRLAPMAAGERRFVHRDGRPEERGAIPPDERAKLSQMRREHGGG